MITARMDNDKYVELSPKWEYEVEWYDSGKVKLKDFPRIYPASDLQLLRDGVPIPEEELKQNPMLGIILGVLYIFLIIAALIVLHSSPTGPTSYEDIENMDVMEQIRSEQRILGK